MVLCLKYDCKFNFSMVSLVITFMATLGSINVYGIDMSFIFTFTIGITGSTYLGFKTFPNISKMHHYVDGSKIFLLPFTPFYTNFFDEFIINWYLFNGLKKRYFDIKVFEIIQESICNFIKLFSFQPLWEWRNKRYFISFIFI